MAVRKNHLARTYSSMRTMIPSTSTAIETKNRWRKEHNKKFKMPGFKQGRYYSSSFYSHPGGYKMCIKVDTNGSGDNADTYVSVYAYLMKGMNDDHL